MRGIGAFAGACLLAAIMISLPVSQGRAEDETREQTLLVFSGFDLWRHGSFSHGGLLWSPNGLDRDGFTFKLLLGTGRYRYISGALGNAKVIGDQLTGFALPGWRVQQDKLIVTIFAGLDLQDHRLSPFDPGGSLHGTKTGLRGGFELWYEPDASSMLAAEAFASTIGASYDARLAYGWLLPGGFYAGPEIAGFRNGNDYHQIRAGAHVTALKIADQEWSAALGWASDSDHRDSLYGRLNLLLRR
jgi:hypothetical protein